MVQSGPDTRGLCDSLREKHGNSRVDPEALGGAHGMNRPGSKPLSYLWCHASTDVADGRKDRADEEQPSAGPLKRERGLEGFLALFLGQLAFLLYLRL